MLCNRPLAGDYNVTGAHDGEVNVTIVNPVVGDHIGQKLVIVVRIEENVVSLIVGVEGAIGVVEDAGIDVVDSGHWVDLLSIS